MRLLECRFIVVRNGGDFGELYAIGAPSLRMNDNSAIKMSLSGKFAQDDTLNLLTDRIRPELVIDGVRTPIGLYLPATVTKSENETTKSMQIEAYDQCWLVRDTKTESLVLYPAGTNYIDLVQSILASCGIALVVAQETDAELAEDRQDWDIGTSYLTIVNQLLSEINYNPLWFDSDGTAILEPASVPSAENIWHTFDLADPATLARPGVQRSTDIYSAPNVFICVCSNADKSGPMVARSENTNPQSQLAIQRRGRRIAKVVQVDNIADQNELQAYADRLRNESMITSETIYLTTGLLPGFGVDNVVGLIEDDEMTVCIERGWSMTLTTGGTMQHTLEKVVVQLG